MPEKTCAKCRRTQPLDQYYRRKVGEEGLRPLCKRCHNDQTIAAERRRAPEWRFTAKLRREYGLTLEQYLEMLADQGGACAICGTAMACPYVDHDHETGAVRGLLCLNCNTGLGQFKDSENVLEAAAAYLRSRR